MANQSKINFKYLFEEKYRPCYVNGVFVDISPKAELIFHFYLERPGLPKKLSYAINVSKDTLTEIEAERQPQDHQNSFVRQIQNGIIMDYVTAVELRELLNDMIIELENKLGINEDEEQSE